MQVRIVSVEEEKKKRAVSRIQTTFSDADLGSDNHFVFQRTTHDQGCFENHNVYWNELISSNETGFWIFEDDVKFIRKPLLQLNQYITQYSLSENSVFYLGHRLVPYQNTSFNRISIDTLHVCTNDLHAYFIGRYAAKAMSSKFYGKPLDVHAREFHAQLDMRAVYPMIAIQEGYNGLEELLFEKQVLFASCLNTKKRIGMLIVIYICIHIIVMKARKC